VRHLLDYIQSCLEQKKWPDLVLFKRSDAFVEKAKLPRAIDINRNEWKVARLPVEPSRNRNTLFLQRRRTITLTGANPGITCSEEETGESKSSEEDDTPLIPRYDHGVLANKDLIANEKTHISLWELVHSLLRLVWRDCPVQLSGGGGRRRDLSE